MQTLEQILSQLEAAHPTLTEVVNGEVVTMSAEQRQQTLQAWAQAQFDAPVVVKTWPSVEEFVEEFTLEECAQIELASDAQIAALRFKLKTWRSSVHANHPLVVAGFAALVASGILTETRKDTILAVE